LLLLVQRLAGLTHLISTVKILNGLLKANRNEQTYGDSGYVE